MTFCMTLMTKLCKNFFQFPLYNNRAESLAAFMLRYLLIPFLNVLTDEEEWDPRRCWKHMRRWARHSGRPYPEGGGMGGFHRGMWHALMRGMMGRGRGRGHHQHPPCGDGDGDGGGWDKRIKCPVCGEFKGPLTRYVCVFLISLPSRS